MNRIHWLSPGDPEQRTGGYLYNARIAAALRQHGVDVIVHELAGQWPWPGVSHRSNLSSVPNDALVIADGLLWPGLQSDERADLCNRCTVWVVVHSLLDKEQASAEAIIEKEMAALRQATGWFATSQRTAALVSSRLGGAPGSVVIPGTAPASTHAGSRQRLLNVAHLTPRKNQAVLLQALAQLMDLDWELDIVGSLERDPDHALGIQKEVCTLGLEGRVHLRGELAAGDLESAYSRASCLVHTADFEAYGMVLTEALTRGLSVISTPAGAIDDLESAMVRRVAVGDVEGLVAQLRTYLDAPESSSTTPPSFPSWSDQAALLVRVLGLDEEGFSVDWLRMREPYDHAARSHALAEAFDDALGDGARTVMEIATGLGSGTRFLMQHMNRQVSWVLVDRDAQLLAALDTDMLNRGVNYRTHQHDLRDLAGLDVVADGVTTQALLDLVSHDWLVHFADWLAERRIPFLGALSVDGRVVWSPGDVQDQDVQKAFRTHQTWDRGFGPSPGPNAAMVLKRLLEERGFQVRMEPADWAISASDTAMVSAMVEGTASAAREAAQDAGVEPALVDAWRAEKISILETLSVRVGHWDLLAIP